MSINVQILVNKIEAILLSIIAENVMLLVCITKLHDFTSNEVAEATSDIGESETIA